MTFLYSFSHLRLKPKPKPSKIISMHYKSRPSRSALLVLALLSGASWSMPEAARRQLVLRQQDLHVAHIRLPGNLPGLALSETQLEQTHKLIALIRAATQRLEQSGEKEELREKLERHKRNLDRLNRMNSTMGCVLHVFVTATLLAGEERTESTDVRGFAFAEGITRFKASKSSYYEVPAAGAHISSPTEKQVSPGGHIQQPNVVRRQWRYPITITDTATGAVAPAVFDEIGIGRNYLPVPFSATFNASVPCVEVREVLHRPMTGV